MALGESNGRNAAAAATATALRVVEVKRIMFHQQQQWR
jgi:hypothetical protein